MRRRRLLLLVALLLGGWLAGACGDDGGGSRGGEPPASPQPSDGEPPATSAPTGVEHLTVEVVAAFPHDDRAYTQGLLVESGTLLESTGQYGESELREVDLESGEVERREALPQGYFGEGLAGVGDRLVQLTWREGVAIVYDRDTFEVLERVRYEGEGWGLCFDDQADHLVMSDGSATLTFRDPRTFAVTGSVEVTADGEPVDRLNELECVDGDVYANVYRTDEIVVIDAELGRVTASIDASPLRAELGDAPRAEVLNGIARDPATGALYLTGKYWPGLYQVELVPIR